MSTSSPSSSPESRGIARTARLLGQKTGPESVMVGVLIVALLLGLIGFAVHALWIASCIVMALGLGFAAANRRRDRIDVVNRLADTRDENRRSAERADDTRREQRPS